MNDPEMAGRIEEYKALRSEILALYARRTSIQNIGTVVFSGIIVIAMRDSSFILAVAANLIFLAFWNDDRRWLESICKTGAYIGQKIEPQVPGLNWEATLRCIPDCNRDNKATSILRRLLSRYQATSFVGMLVAAILLSRTGCRTYTDVLVTALYAAEWLAFAMLAAGIDFSKYHQKYNDAFRVAAQQNAGQVSSEGAPSAPPDEPSA